MNATDNQRLEKRNGWNHVRKMWKIETTDGGLKCDKEDDGKNNIMTFIGNIRSSGLKDFVMGLSTFIMY